MQFHYLLEVNNQRWQRAMIIAVIILCFITFFSLSVGELWFLPFTQDPLEQQILLSLRLPRVIAAILVGAALAVSGASLQVLLENPLAESGVLGISGGSSLAVVLLLFVMPDLVTPISMMFAALIGALAFTGILVWLANKKTMSTTTLLLVGVALGILSSALITWAFYFSSDLNLRQLMYWLMGSFSGVGWLELSLSLVLLPALLLLCVQGQSLDLLMLGEIQAKQLGMNTEQLRIKLILLISLLVAASVAIAGIIGFVGLVVPHFLRLWFGSENRYLLPLSAIAGACLLLIADLFGRLAIAQAEIPVGAVTTIIGAPLFIWMLVKRSC